jgi:hypothetical protein
VREFKELFSEVSGSTVSMLRQSVVVQRRARCKCAAGAQILIHINGDI